MLKTDIGFENDLFEINFFKRIVMTKFRLTNHSLMIEKGRDINLPKAMRFCPFCPCRNRNAFPIGLPYIPCIEMYQQTTRSKPSLEYYTTEFIFIYLLSDNLINNFFFFLWILF